MVSPTETLGQDATDAAIGTVPRAATTGEAVAYASRGAFGAPTGANLESELVSRREQNGWQTQNITPLFNPSATDAVGAYPAMVFTPDLGEGLASTSASLIKEVPTPGSGEHDLYLVGFGAHEYRYVAQTYYPMGASTDLSRVVFGEQGEVSEWQDGAGTAPVGINNEHEPLSASVGDTAEVNENGYRRAKDVWHAVSGDGSCVYFTSPGFDDTPFASAAPGTRQLYVRVNVGARQSSLGAPEAAGTGTLTKGSSTVASLVTAAGYIDSGEVAAGASELSVATFVGQFRVGQPLSGSAFAPGTTVAAVSPGVIGLSQPTIEPMASETQIFSDGPVPFVVGQELSGNGIAAGTVVSGIAAGSLTLSKPAVSSGVGVELRAGGECIVAGDACTVEVSASQRELENPAGPQSARYWAASTDGSKVFFTSTAELTEDADTGPSGNAPNLYECELVLEKEGHAVPPRCVLKDLTVPTNAEHAEDTEGAAVQGVVQVSEDGAYVYFVAKGALAAGATEQQCRTETEQEEHGEEPKQTNLGCNLYATHNDGAPVLVATLAANDSFDWSSEEPDKTGPGVTTAVVSPSGSYLAFMSERSLTGYDNREAQQGECKGGKIAETGQRGTEDCREAFLYDAATGGLVCASCNPSGARPVGPAGFRTQPGVAYVGYRPRNLLADGRLFFNSSDGLVANASGGQENVYEYEAGRVYAISDVAGAHESFFMDASGTEEGGGEGGNVFFATSDDLVPQDTGNNVVVYDARIDGGFQPPTAPAACTSGETCKPSPPSPLAAFGPPATATITPPDNLAPPSPAVVKLKSGSESVKCKKGYVKKKNKCIKKKKAKRASHKRGARS